MAPAYNPEHLYPFPVLPIKILQVGVRRASEEFSALVDTGADATLIPEDTLQQLGMTALYKTRVRSHWGKWRTANVYIADLEIDNIVLPAIEVVADSTSKEILFGRNVRNKLILLLDGPGKQIDLLEKRPRGQ